MFLAPKCDVPELEHAYIGSNNTYVNNPIEVFCDDGFIPQSRTNARIRCIYNEHETSLEWADTETVNCIPTSCNPHPDFQYIINTPKTYYDIGEVISFTCPNGYRFRTRCVLDQITQFGVWDYIGNCVGTNYSLLTISRLFYTYTFLRSIHFAMSRVKMYYNA